MPRITDITGERFGYLVVTGFAGSWKDTPNSFLQRHWDCDCDCGGSLVATTQQLRGKRRWHCDACPLPRRGDDYRENYLKYLATFSEDERRKLAAFLRGRTSPSHVAEAVEIFMRFKDRKDAA